MWALGHIGSSPGGLHLLLEEEVIDDLIDLAETCPILSIRGYVESRGWFVMCEFRSLGISGGSCILFETAGLGFSAGVLSSSL